MFGPATRSLPKLPLGVEVVGRHAVLRAPIATSPSRSAPASGSAHDRDRETASTAQRAKRAAHPAPGKTGEFVDDRLNVAGPIRKQLNKVFPDHWSFMMGEIALYSFIVLLLTGTYLTLLLRRRRWARSSTTAATSRCRASTMSRAYASTLDISFDVRGGLIIRQIHHWAALLFVAAMLIHMFRVFFTGAFRKPRELNWIIGILLIVLGVLEGFAGYSLPDDLLSGTGPADRRRDHAVDPGHRHLGVVPGLRWRRSRAR